MNRGRVVIAGGSRAQAEALAAALARAGCEGERAPSVADALLAVARGDAPDLVVLDGQPDDVRALKERFHPAFVPVIVLTEEPGAAARVQALHAGADDCLAKPCDADEVAARAAAMLRIKAAQDALRSENAELERLSVTDALTGLFNRRYFEYRLQQEVERARRHGAPVSALLVDLDHFKRVNDRYGHAVGDAVLRAAAGLLRAELRQLDLCARWGGEELAVLLPDTGPAGAAVVAERLLRALREGARFTARRMRAPEALPEAFAVTASAGLASFPAAGVRGGEDLLAAADAALYRAKDAGRDRACAAADVERALPATRPHLAARPAFA